MGHAHQMIVDHHREIIGGSAVGFGNNKIIKLGQIKVHPSMNDIVYTQMSRSWDLKTDGMRFARGNTTFYLFFGQVAASPGIAERLFPFPLDRALGFQLFRGAEAVVSLAFIQ